MNFRQGWRDFMSGKEVDQKAYDKWTPHQQLEYESGRRSAAAYKGTINKRRKTVPRILDLPIAVSDEKHFTYRKR